MKALLSLASFFFLALSCLEDPKKLEISRASEHASEHAEDILAPEVEEVSGQNEKVKAHGQKVIENLKKKRPAGVNEFLKKKE